MGDDFAQSREPDDLFADEIEPAEQPTTRTTSSTVSAATARAPVTTTQSPQAVPQNQRAPASNRGGHGSRGPKGLQGSIHAGNNRGGRGRGTPRATREASPQKEAAETQKAEPAADDVTIEADGNTIPQIAAGPVVADQEQRVASVRGDRSATGPAKPAKRTEAQLTELMSSMRLKNAAKAEAHERAEKDQASFLQREKQAAAKRVEERKAIREQDMERAKNRQRKIKAQGVREWDSEKVESDIVDRSRGNSSNYMRGAHGGVSGVRTDTEGFASERYRDDDEREPFRQERGRGSSRGRGRGRGQEDFVSRSNNGNGGRGGRGRGGRAANGTGTTNTTLNTGDGDFPALPASSATTVVPPIPTGEASKTELETPASRSQNTISTSTETYSDKDRAKPPVSHRQPTHSGLAQSSWAEEMATSGEQKV